MPTYEYSCPSCGHEEEHFLKLAEYDKQLFCEECQSPLDKLVSLTAEVQWGKGLSVTNITGIPGQKVYSCKEADQVAESHGQTIIPKSEFKNKMGMKPKEPNVKKQLDKIAKEIN